MILLTIKEAAAAIRMSQGWIKKAVRQGDLRAIHFGRSVRIRPEDLEEYVLSVQAKEKGLLQWDIRKKA